MPSLTVRNIPKGDYAALKADAKRNRRSMNAEILAMFADKANMAQRRASAAKAMKELDKLRDKVSRKYPNQPDSVDLIREDRDGR
jgi:plasmid stability protein